MSDETNAAQDSARPLASKSLSRRARQLLDGIFGLASHEFERVLVASLDDFEQQLFAFAEQGRSAAEETRWLEARRSVTRNRQQLSPHFMLALTAELASLGVPHQPGATAMASAGIGVSSGLSLFSKQDMDETAIVADISNRVEMRNHTPLYLLGQRLGVLACMPGFGCESIPIGPQVFCRMLRDSSDCLDLAADHRRMFFKVVEKQIMLTYGNLIDSVNAYLAANTILPNFQYMSTRARQKSPATAAVKSTDPTPPSSPKGYSNQDFGLTWPAELHDAAAKSPVRARDAIASPPPAGDLPAPGTTAHTPIASLESMRVGASAAGSTDAVGSDPDFDSPAESEGEANYKMMRQLLATRNLMIGNVPPAGGQAGARTERVPAWLLQNTLSKLQGRPPAPVMIAGKPTTRNIQHIKQDLMSQLQLHSNDQEASVLNEEHSDVIDLMGMLFENINKDVKPNSLAAQLLENLQVPLLRVALQDREFFTKRDHPAKQMLSVIAESGVHWLGDDADPALVSKMNTVVGRTVREFDGDISLFQQLLSDINSQLQLLAHKAEVAERRHIEAARGKERLALARTQAAAAVAHLLEGAALPRFTQALINEAWTDVMALVALRQGEGSNAWKQQLGVAERLIQAAKAAPGKSPVSADEKQQLKQKLEDSLTQVGYQPDEITAIAQRLVDPQSDQEDDPTSRTELAMWLKSRAHFGVDAKPAKDNAAPLTAAEQACFNQLKLVAFGTWFEFNSNQQGDRIRRRLAWYSTTTGNSVFVNQRGQKVGEYHLSALAKLMAHEELHIVEEKSGGIIDRAWQSVMTALRSFSSQPATQGIGK